MMAKVTKKKSSKSVIDPEILKIGGESIKRGERKQVYLDSAALYDGTKLRIPVEVIRGKMKGPVLFISAAIHGDEINGVEIARRILKRKILSKIKGTLIVIPVVNVFGFNKQSRYLPDRKDLNRSFPGSSRGSLASRMANTFMKEIVSKCTHGIDLHTGAIHRTNLPQIRAFLNDAQTKELAEGFGVPVVINSDLRDGSLREAGRKKKVSMLLFEGGEALRFEENIIKIGLNGCLSVMKKIGMIDRITIAKTPTIKGRREAKIYYAESSSWIRAPRSGSFVTKKKVGDYIEKDDLIATISDPFGKEMHHVHAPEDGIMIGASLLPLVNQGDAMFHLAVFSDHSKVSTALKDFDFYPNGGRFSFANDKIKRAPVG
ncbi:MAG: succinylglutamate desuccinylase/aspartoacylase family protein [Halobacteriovoraceae bacterium]|nr:succinylglutamate desuccinylase/aspartoacylase family protein [Halobacteriovoraceae bacterium]